MDNGKPRSVVCWSATPIDPDSMEHVFGMDNGNSPEHVLEVAQGELAGVRGLLENQYIVDRLVLKETFLFGSVLCRSLSQQLYAEDTARFVNFALSSNPDGIVSVYIDVKMKGEEEGWRVFFNGISCLGRVNFEIQSPGRLWRFPSKDLAESMGINGYVKHGSRFVYDNSPEE